MNIDKQIDQWWLYMGCKYTFNKKTTLLFYGLEENIQPQPTPLSKEVSL